MPELSPEHYSLEALLDRLMLYFSITAKSRPFLCPVLKNSFDLCHEILKDRAISNILAPGASSQS